MLIATWIFLAWGQLLAPVTRGQSAHESGCAEYRAGRYAEARAHWEAALREEHADALDRAALLYNIGNAAYRSKRPLEAAGWYTAALRLAPRDEDAWHNLEFARREAGLEPADRGDLTATARRLLTVMTVGEAERVLLAALVVLGLALAWEALRGGVAAKATCWALAALVLLAAVPWCWQRAHGDDALVFAAQPEGAAFTSEPRADSTLIGRLAPGSQAERIDALPGWVRVRREDGQVGWIEARACVPLSAPFVLEP